jgi:hypothetical protein
MIEFMNNQINEKKAYTLCAIKLIVKLEDHLNDL